MPVLSAGKLAPTFELSGMDGKKYALQEALARGPVLAAFFKVSCPTCQYTLPFLERLHKQLQEKNVQVWAISQDRAGESRRFAQEYGITFPILLDDNGYEVSRSYGLTYVPTILLIAPDGHVQLSSEGFCKAELLEMQKSLAQDYSATPAPLFLPTERVPEFKPG